VSVTLTPAAAAVAESSLVGARFQRIYWQLIPKEAAAAAGEAYAVYIVLRGTHCTHLTAVVLACCCLPCACVCLCAVLGAAQKDLLSDEKREELWKVLEMARGGWRQLCWQQQTKGGQLYQHILSCRHAMPSIHRVCSLHVHALLGGF
jgi:hypothetical protein